MKLHYILLSILGFKSMLAVYREDISGRRFGHFPWNSECEVKACILKTIVDHLVLIAKNFSLRFADIDEMVFFPWLSQPFSTDLCDSGVDY